MNSTLKALLALLGFAAPVVSFTIEDRAGLAAYLSYEVITGEEPAPPCKPDGETEVCPDCGGKGYVGDGTVRMKCLRCDGTGRIEVPACEVTDCEPEETVPAEEKKSPPMVSLSQTKASPVRMPGPRWNVSGRNSYSTEYLASHLMRSHGVDVNGYTREELQIMHDNVHNGYSAMGGAKTSSSSGRVVKRRVIRMGSSCPGGRCP